MGIDQRIESLNKALAPYGGGVKKRIDGRNSYQLFIDGEEILNPVRTAIGWGITALESQVQLMVKVRRSWGEMGVAV